MIKDGMDAWEECVQNTQTLSHPLHFEGVQCASLAASLRLVPLMRVEEVNERAPQPFIPITTVWPNSGRETERRERNWNESPAAVRQCSVVKCVGCRMCAVGHRIFRRLMSERVLLCQNANMPTLTWSIQDRRSLAASVSIIFCFFWEVQLCFFFFELGDITLRNVCELQETLWRSWYTEQQCDGGQEESPQCTLALI